MGWWRIGTGQGGLRALAGGAALALAIAGVGPDMMVRSTALAQEAPAGGAGSEAVMAEVDALLAALRIDDTIAVLREEGLDYGRSLEEDMFPGAGGASWQATVALIYDGDRMGEAFRAALIRALEDDPAEVAAIRAFFESELGRRVVDLEIEARRSLLDDAVEEASKVALEELRAEDGPRLAALDRFVTVNDLVESNVMGALNSNLAFYRGMQRGGAFGEEMTEEQMLGDVWGQEQEIRQSTTEWVYSYLNLSYAPLSDADLAEYTAFCESAAGQKVNAALFAAFDEVFTPISEALGVAVARQMAGQDI